MQKLGAIATVVVASVATGTAYAQDAPPAAESDTSQGTTSVEVKAPKRAFEIGVSGGYTQPFGDVGLSSIHDFVSVGGAVGLTLGIRATPHWSFEGIGQFHESATGDHYDGTNADVRGVAVGAQGTYHFRPYKVLDPYASLGAGYRMLWLVPEGAANDLVHGFEVAKAVLGLDVRASPSVAIGPQIGADLDVFVWDNPEGSAGNQTLHEARPSTFLFAGLAGRFDLGGDRVPHDRVAVKEPEPKPAAGPPPPPPKKPEAPPPTAIVIEPRILEICKIEGPKAYFDFDRSDVKPPDQNTLDLVAECFANGPLKGRGMSLTGHADPRGTDEYNNRLGKKRADAVGEYLTGKGVPSPTIGTETRGEKDATGTDEETWQYDRRVDLKLKD